MMAMFINNLQVCSDLNTVRQPGRVVKITQHKNVLNQQLRKIVLIDCDYKDF